MRAKPGSREAPGRLRPFLAALAAENPRRLAWVLTVQVITALTQEPALLVLDEATNSLDAENETAVLDALAMLHGRMTILVIAHQHSALRDADQVITVSEGRVVSIRSHGGLADRPA